MELVYTDKKLKKCPFCKCSVPVVRSPLWNGNNGYHGHYEYFVTCRNTKCKVKPTTRKYDDIYRRSDEAIDKAVDAWNDRAEK